MCWQTHPEARTAARGPMTHPTLRIQQTFSTRVLSAGPERVTNRQIQPECARRVRENPCRPCRRHRRCPIARARACIPRARAGQVLRPRWCRSKHSIVEVRADEEAPEWRSVPTESYAHCVARQSGVQYLRSEKGIRWLADRDELLTQGQRRCSESHILVSGWRHLELIRATLPQADSQFRPATRADKCRQSTANATRTALGMHAESEANSTSCQRGAPSAIECLAQGR